jgi:hypothetical protein
MIVRSGDFGARPPQWMDQWMDHPLAAWISRAVQHDRRDASCPKLAQDDFQCPGCDRILGIWGTEGHGLLPVSLIQPHY